MELNEKSKLLVKDTGIDLTVYIQIVAQEGFQFVRRFSYYANQKDLSSGKTFASLHQVATSFETLDTGCFLTVIVLSL